MAFRFDIAEPIDKGFRRIGKEQLEKAHRALGNDADRAAGVHGVRKALKRTRALLRLARPGLAEGVFEVENARLRDIGRLLAGARDSHVMMQTLVQLEQAYDLGTSGVTAPLRAELSTLRPPESADEPDQSVYLTAGKRLADSAKAFRRIKLDDISIDVLADGLQRSFRTAKKALAVVSSEPTDEAVHELRKGLQLHWRHMMLLSAAWPEMLQVRADRAREVSQLLGRDHDLAVLATYTMSGIDGLEPQSADAIADLCREGQARLRAEALPLTAQLLADRPNDLARRTILYWVERAALATVPPPVDKAEPTAPSGNRRTAPRKPAKSPAKSAVHRK